MTLIELTNKIKMYAESQYNHPKVMEGSVYTNLNTKELTYPCINIDNVNVVKRDNEVVYSYYVYYADRLNEDGSNTLQIQSEATTSLELILNRIAESGAMNLDEIPNVIITPYKMKFTDMCAGAWMQVSIHTLNGIDYCNDGSTINTLYVTANGSYNAEDYDRVTVDVPQYFVGANWFYAKSRSDGSTVSLTVPTGVTPVNLEYSTDRIEWQNWDFSPLTVNSGETVYFRGNNPDGFSTDSRKLYKFAFRNGSFDIGGDLRSLLDKTITITEVPCEDCFTRLFERNENSLINVAPDLLAGFKTLKKNCFSHMFSLCRNLVTAPELPAMNLAYGCYNGMFYSTAIVQAPELPATTLEQFCYYSMFENCSNLEKAPELPADNLKYVCYSRMFYGCSKINYIKCLATNRTTSYALGTWVQGVSPTGTFVKAVNSEWSIGVDGIPEGWTVKDNEIELIDTTVTTNGTYTAEVGKGFRQVTVDVPTGITPTGTVTFIENGIYDVTDDATATVDVPVEDYYQSGYTSGHTDGYAEGYASGRTDGFNEGYSSGHTDGFNDGYASGHTDGYSQGYQSGTTDGYQSGYTEGFTSGYTSGRTDGYAEGYASGHTDGFNEGYASGRTDGFQSGYTSGYTDGYASGRTDGYASGYTSGYTDGVASVPLTSTGFTENGVYTKAQGGWNNVTVNVPKLPIRLLTQAEYDALTTKDPNIVYVINN